MACRARYTLQAASALARHPRDGFDRLAERLAEIRDERSPKPTYSVAREGDLGLAAMLGVPSLDRALLEFGDVWSDAVGSVARHGLGVGRGAFSGWDDADPAFGRAAWCLARLLKPVTVVETGVARGFTTRVVLEALQLNGCGRLWSIDVAPLTDPAVAAQRGAAVTDAIRSRWSLIDGSSRRRLPRLIDQLTTIDLFIHDSLHTHRNMTFEFGHAWGALRPGGFLLADDVHRNAAFERAVRDFGGPPAIVCESDDGRGMFGLVHKPAISVSEPGRTRAEL